MRRAVRVAGGWSALHRWCVRHLLRIRVIQQGGPIDGPALYAMRHESFFEAIDARMIILFTESGHLHAEGETMTGWTDIVTSAIVFCIWLGVHIWFFSPSSIHNLA